MTPDEEHAARKEALDVLRPLVTAEETRSTNLNTRALGIISAGSLVTAIAAFFAKDVLSGTALEKLEGTKDLAVGVLIVAVLLLVLAVGSGVYTLWPRSRSYVEPDGLTQWAAGNVADSENAIRQATLRDLAGLLSTLRTFNTSKVNRLKTTYVLYALAVAAIAIDAGIFFTAAF